MRNGELLAVQWHDIDLEAGTLQVKRTVFDGMVSPPKTASGRRTIRLSKLAIAALWQYRTNTAERHTSEWVFSSRAGVGYSANFTITAVSKNLDPHEIMET
jgi:integrase